MKTLSIIEIKQFSSNFLYINQQRTNKTRLGIKYFPRIVVIFREVQKIVKQMVSKN